MVADVPVGVATTVLPSNTRYPVTVPLDAPQDREIDEEVTLVTLGLPGAPGTAGPPPPQPCPLIVQLAGVPGPDPLKPNDTEAPAASDPFQDALLKMKCWPLPERTESQLVVIVEPA